MTNVSPTIEQTGVPGDKLTLSDVVSVRSSFHRSANIETDIGSASLRQAYTLNTIAYQHATGILQDIASPTGAKAWAVTGPFGSGKSSFAAFLADVLTNPESIAPEYRKLRHENGIDDERYSIIPIVGHRASVRDHLTKALFKDDSDLDLDTALDRVIEDAAKRDYRGVFIVFDEFNRVLDYESRHPWDSDMGLLQSLAERAARSDGNLLLMTVQHMSFADYAGNSAAGALTDEWRKIQGRFRDISFFLPHAQSLELMGRALQSDVCPDHPTRTKHNDLISTLQTLTPLQRVAPVDSLQSTWPMHPITAIVATELFRSKLAQNERSLFAFLASQEPFGFQAFLKSETFNESSRMFSLAQLFDYVVSTIGAAASTGIHGQTWAQVQLHCDAISGEESRLEEDLVKATFLLNRYGGPVGLHATSALLALAHNAAPISAIEAAIDNLIHQNILRKRRYRGDFTLTSGSGYDFDTELEKARSHANASSVADRLMSMPSAQLRRTARRHYVRTGNLRTYSILITDASQKTNVQPIKSLPADLEIQYVIPESRAQARAIRDDLQHALKNDTNRQNPPRIYAVVREPEPIHQITIDVSAVTWLLEHDGELLNDEAARREVISFRDEADTKALGMVGPLFGWGGYRIDPTLCYWIVPGKVGSPTTAMALHRVIDEVLSSTYSGAPDFSNELINRDTPSSAAARARRELITAMVLHEGEERLGITGHPPEAAIYETLLHREGFHQKAGDDRWILTRPNGQWGEVWDAITRSIEAQPNDHVPLAAIAHTLSSPPFGLKKGPIPIIIAAYLIACQDSVSLFEDGTYVPELRPEVFERMLRSFEVFSLRRLPTDGIQSEMLDVLREDLVAPASEHATGSNHSALVEAVRTILTVVTTLPHFSRRTKVFLDHPSAPAVREATLRSQDPQQLLLNDLPEVLGHFSLKTRDEQRAYARELRSALVSLESAYERMLNYIGDKTRHFVGFGENDIADGVMFNRMMPLLGKRPPGPLGQLIAALAMTAGDWRENVGRAVMEGKPTQQWDDRDVTTFELKMHQLATTLLEFEALIGTQQREHQSALVASVSLIDQSGRFEQMRRTIAVDPMEQSSVQDTARELVSLLRSQQLSESATYAALVEAIALVRGHGIKDSANQRGAHS